MRLTRTYLQLNTPEQFRSGFGTFQDVELDLLPCDAGERYRHCYRTVGAAYHWRDR